MNLYDCKILLVDDERALREMVYGFLQCAGFHQVAMAGNCKEAEKLFPDTEPHLILLDVMLPDGDGFSLLRKLRQISEVPVIFLSARDEDESRLRGLGLGADDYITKPFKLGELCSRIRALLRRSGRDGTDCANRLISGSLTIDLLGGSVSLNDRPLELTAREYRLLCLLVRNAEQTVLRNTILDALWDSGGSFVDDNTLSVYIRRLREKIEADPSNPEHLLTVRGFGYRWRA